MGPSHHQGISNRKTISGGTPHSNYGRPSNILSTSPSRRETAKTYIKQMMNNGVCRPSSSPWASPLHMVKKKDGSWRPCGDYRALNLRTIPDRYPMRNVADFVNELHGCTIFSKIDLKSAFWQVPMSAESIAKTAITTPFGLYEFTLMPFGLRNASQTFQRLTDNIFRSMPFVSSYRG